MNVEANLTTEQTFWRRFLRPTWEERKRMLRSETTMLTVTSYVLVLYAYSWPADYRTETPAFVIAAWSAFLVRTLHFHLGLLLLAAATCMLLLRAWRHAAATVPLLVITLGPAATAYWPKPSERIIGKSINVMSANLLMVNKNTGPLLDEIRNADPDVLLLQEYTRHWHLAMQEALGERYASVAVAIREDSFGAAVYSKIPFEEESVTTKLDLGGEALPQIRAVINFSGQDVALYNIHLLPPRKLDYTIGHRRQFADLLDRLAKEQLPVIVGGDFNFTSATTNAVDLKAIGLRDVHAIAGRGRGTTWPVISILRWLPGLCIDHVYLGRALTCTSLTIGVGRGSDHRPIIAEIGFREIDAALQQSVPPMNEGSATAHWRTLFAPTTSISILDRKSVLVNADLPSIGLFGPVHRRLESTK